MAKKSAVLDKPAAVVNASGSQPAARALADLSRAELDEAYRLTADQAAPRLVELAKYRKVLADLSVPGMEQTLAEFLSSEALAEWRRAVEDTARLEPALREVEESGCIVPFLDARAARAANALAEFDDERFIRQLGGLVSSALNRGTAVFPRLVKWPAEGEAVARGHFEVLVLPISAIDELPRSRGAKVKRAVQVNTDEDGTSVTVREPVIRLKPGAARYAAIKLAAAAEGLSVEAYVLKELNGGLRD